MSRGGISKASKGINLSEDIFAGFNSVLRGGSVRFREYIQVGKGRDVGLQQLFKFEAKLSQGNWSENTSLHAAAYRPFALHLVHKC
jgi:callose synthase